MNVYNISLIEQFFKPEKDEKEKGEEVSILQKDKKKEKWQKKPDTWNRTTVLKIKLHAATQS